jgi:type I restriction enzyme S subunit
MQDEILTETLSLIDEETPLPEGWRLVRLSKVCQFIYGSSLTTSSRQKGDVPVYGSNGIVGFHNEAITDGETIIIGRKGSVGEVNFSKVSCFPIDTTYFIDKSATELDLKFLYYLLQRINLGELSKSTAIPGLSREDAYALEIPLPPTIEEQRRIASVLDEQMKAVEQSRLAVEEQLKAANLLPNTFLHSVFESEEAQNWQKGKAQHFIDVRDGTHDTPKYVKTGVPLVTSKNLKNGQIDFSEISYISETDHEQIKKRSFVENGDILYAMIGTIGNPVIVNSNDEFSIKNVALFKMKNSSILTDYFYYFLQSSIVGNQVDAFSMGGIQKFVSLSFLRNLDIQFPQTETEQRKIAEKLNKQMQAVETLKQSLTEKLKAIKKLPAALLRKAFAGEI